MGRAPSMYVSRSERRLVEPLWGLAQYIRQRLGEQVSELRDYQIARLIGPLYDLVTGNEDRPIVVSAMIDEIERQLGIPDDDVSRVNDYVARIVEEVWWRKRRRPTKAVKLVNELRTLFIKMVRGRLVVEFEPFSEKQSEKGKDGG